MFVRSDENSYGPHCPQIHTLCVPGPSVRAKSVRLTRNMIPIGSSLVCGDLSNGKAGTPVLPKLSYTIAFRGRPAGG